MWFSNCLILKPIADSRLRVLEVCSRIPVFRKPQQIPAKDAILRGYIVGGVLPENQTAKMGEAKGRHCDGESAKVDPNLHGNTPQVVCGSKSQVGVFYLVHGGQHQFAFYFSSGIDLPGPDAVQRHLYPRLIAYAKDYVEG